jgi:hypothetical protein
MPRSLGLMVQNDMLHFRIVLLLLAALVPVAVAFLAPANGPSVLRGRGAVQAHPLRKRLAKEVSLSHATRLAPHSLHSCYGVQRVEEKVALLSLSAVGGAAAAQEGDPGADEEEDGDPGATPRTRIFAFLASNPNFGYFLSVACCRQSVLADPTRQPHLNTPLRLASVFRGASSMLTVTDGAGRPGGMDSVVVQRLVRRATSQPMVCPHAHARAFLGGQRLRAPFGRGR